MSVPAFSRTVHALSDLIGVCERLKVSPASSFGGTGGVDADYAAREWLAGICRQANLDPPEILTLRAYGDTDAGTSALKVQISELISRHRQQVQRLLDQQASKEHTARMLLNQYQRQWIAGVRNLTETYLQKRTGGVAVAALLDPQKSAPQVDAFLSAISLPSLIGKINDYITDRMADLVAGLSGLATKLELPGLPLGDTSAKWSTRALPGKIRRELVEKQAFPAKGAKRGGLVGNLTGKRQAIAEERKTQVAKAMRIVAHEVDSDFTAWCIQFVSAVELTVCQQLDLKLQKQSGLSNNQLKEQADRLAKAERALQNAPAAPAENPPSVAGWFAFLASRRWIPPFQRRFS